MEVAFVAPPAARPVAAPALRRRPVPGLGGGGRCDAAGLPALGEAPGGRGLEGGRDGAARDRRRGRAHPHRPRRQGPGVPDHRAVGHDQPSCGRRAAACRCCFPPGRRWALKLKKDLETPEFEPPLPIEEQMDHHERLRLLYVAATRARDHLIVSVHRKENRRPASTAAELFTSTGCGPGRSWSVDAALVATCRRPSTSPDRPSAAPVAAHRSTTRVDGRTTAPALGRSPPRPRGLRRRSWPRSAELAAAERRRPGLAKEPRDVDLPPWQKGRYGTAIGRAVHGVLQTVDLATGDGLAEAAPHRPPPRVSSAGRT